MVHFNSNPIYIFFRACTYVKSSSMECKNIIRMMFENETTPTSYLRRNCKWHLGSLETSTWLSQQDSHLISHPFNQGRLVWMMDETPKWLLFNVSGGGLYIYIEVSKKLKILIVDTFPMLTSAWLDLRLKCYKCFVIYFSCGYKIISNWVIILKA